MMTTPDPSRQWCVDAAELLYDTATRAARLASAVAVDWLDPDGRAWAERINALRRDLDEAAHAASALARRLANAEATQPGLADALAAALRGASTTGYGPRLGDTSGARVDDAQGMRIAQLPDPSAP